MFLNNFKLLEIFYQTKTIHFVIYQKNKTKKENEKLIEEMTIIVTNIRQFIDFISPELGFTKKSTILSFETAGYSSFYVKNRKS